MPITSQIVRTPRRRTQPYVGTASLRSGVARDARIRPQTATGQSIVYREVCAGLVQLLADTMTLRDLYVKYGSQASASLAPVFHQICERHQIEQTRLIDLVVGLIYEFGGTPIFMAADVAAVTSIPTPPKLREDSMGQCHRLLNAHDLVAEKAMSVGTRVSALAAAGRGPLIIAEIVLTSTIQIWLLGQYMESEIYPFDVSPSQPALGCAHVMPSRTMFM